MNYEHNYGSSTANTSSPISASSEPHPQVTLTIADRNILRHRLATMRTETDALIQMLDRQDHKTIDQQLFQRMVQRWSDLVDATLNPRNG